MGLWDEQDASDRARIDALRAIIMTADPAVTQCDGPVMGNDNAIAYEEQGVFKYALARTKTGVTVHTMVLYAHPDLADTVKALFKGAKLQKGCINFRSLSDIDPEAFQTLMTQSAARDFSSVIASYQKKRKKT